MNQKNNFVTLGVLKSKNGLMKEIISSAEYMANLGMNILIVGEPGTGRDTLAQTIHSLSPAAFVPLNIIRCKGAKGKDLHLREGAFNYVDEVHLLKSGLQGKLIREMDSAPNAIVIASAHTCIGQMLDKKAFKLDLYRRLAAVRIGIPCLCQRKEDIPYLIRDALKTANKKYGLKVRIDSRAVKPLTHYRYKANINELYTIIDRAVISCCSDTIKVNSILSLIDVGSLTLMSMMNDSMISYKQSMERYERELILNAISDSNSLKMAAEILHVKMDFLQSRCRALGLPDSDPEGEELIDDVG